MNIRFKSAVITALGEKITIKICVVINRSTRQTKRSCIRMIFDEAGSGESRGRGPSGCWGGMMFARDPHVGGRAVRASWDTNTRLRLDIECQHEHRIEKAAGIIERRRDCRERSTIASQHLPRMFRERDICEITCQIIVRGWEDPKGQLTGYTIPSDCNPSRVD